MAVTRHDGVGDTPSPACSHLSYTDDMIVQTTCSYAPAYVTSLIEVFAVALGDAVVYTFMSWTRVRSSSLTVHPLTVHQLSVHPQPGSVRIQAIQALYISVLWFTLAMTKS
eukprot:scpid86994/ scgid27418/ 